MMVYYAIFKATNTPVDKYTCNWQRRLIRTLTSLRYSTYHKKSYVYPVQNKIEWHVEILLLITANVYWMICIYIYLIIYRTYTYIHIYKTSYRSVITYSCVSRTRVNAIIGTKLTLFLLFQIYRWNCATLVNRFRIARAVIANKCLITAHTNKYLIIAHTSLPGFLEIIAVLVYNSTKYNPTKRQIRVCGTNVYLL